MKTCPAGQWRPRYDSFDDFNAHLEQKCLERQGDTLRGYSQTIGERLILDLDALMGLPVAEYEACDHVSTPLPDRVCLHTREGGHVDLDGALPEQ